MDHEKWLQQHDEMLADHDRFMADFRERQAKTEANQATMEANLVKLEASQQKTEATLRRAIRLSVLDARRQRKRNVEFDEKMAQIAELMKVFLERGTNGKH